MMVSVETPPLVSVVIPAFNAEATLNEAVASVLAGTYDKVEIIIVDDSSTDGTAALAETLVRDHPHVRVHHQANMGLSTALNRGFALARGDYVARLDADDIWHPSKLAKQIEMALGEPQLAFIYSWARYIDEHGRVSSNGPRQEFPRHALRRGLYESLVGGGSSALIKRPAIIKAGGCDESFTAFEDLLLQLKISQSHPIGFVPEYLVGYRVRPGSLTSDPAKMLREWRRVRKQVKQEFPGVPDQVQAWAHARRCTGLAEAFAWRGHKLRSAALLLEAARFDPKWTFLFLRFRIGRRLRKTTLTPPVPHHPAFFDCNPGEVVAPAMEDDDPSLAKLVDSRNARLAALDTAANRS